MRTINEIIIHCSDTREGKDFTVKDITSWHKARGFNTIGYHYVIYRDGSIHVGRPEDEQGAHCKEGGHNRHSIGICYIGGKTADGTGYKDTRTPEQKEAMLSLLRQLKARYPHARVYGHRDFAARACPCFDARSEYKNLAIGLILAFAGCILSGCRSHSTTAEEQADMSVQQAVSQSAISSAMDKFYQNIVLNIDSIVFTQLSMPPVPEAGNDSSIAQPSATRSSKPHAVKRQGASPRYGKVVVSGINMQAVTSDSCISQQVNTTDIQQQSTKQWLAKKKEDKKVSAKPWLSLYIIVFIIIAIAVAVAIAMAKSSPLCAAVRSLLRKVMI